MIIELVMKTRQMMAVALTLLIPLGATAQQHRYSHQDSARAKACFDSSWHYSIGSAQHQQYLDSALMAIPTMAYYWQQKAMPLHKAGKYELAGPFLDSAVKYDPERWLEYRAFMRCIYEKHYRAALEDLRTARRTYGNRVVMDHPYDFYISLCHMQLGDTDSSEIYMGGCIAAETKANGEKWVHYNHLFYMGIIQFGKNRYESAIGYFDRSLVAYPQYAEAHYYRALCLYELGRKAEALTAIEAASANFEKGYTMNEDNALHVDYPHQLRRAYVSSGLEWMRKEANKK